jgi:hypothetical protein
MENQLYHLRQQKGRAAPHLPISPAEELFHGLAVIIEFSRKTDRTAGVAYSWAYPCLTTSCSGQLIADPDRVARGPAGNTLVALARSVRPQASGFLLNSLNSERDCSRKVHLVSPADLRMRLYVEEPGNGKHVLFLEIGRSLCALLSLL